jgi:hypothetical protein
MRIGKVEIIAPLILNHDTTWRWVANLTFRPLYPRERTPVSIEQEAGWDTEPVWTIRKIYKDLSPTGIKTPDLPVRNLVAISTIPSTPDDSSGTNQFP